MFAYFQVYWCITRGKANKNIWVVDRLPANISCTKPFDLQVTRHMFFEEPMLTYDYFVSLCNLVHRNQQGTPLKFPGDRIGVTNVSYFQEQLQNNRLEKVKPITLVRENGVELEDGGRLEVDIIVYCTGYATRYPVLDHIWSVEAQAKNELYYHVLPVEDQLQGVAIIGRKIFLTP